MKDSWGYRGAVSSAAGWRAFVCGLTLLGALCGLLTPPQPGARNDWGSVPQRALPGTQSEFHQAASSTFEPETGATRLQDSPEGHPGRCADGATYACTRYAPNGAMPLWSSSGELGGRDGSEARLTQRVHRLNAPLVGLRVTTSTVMRT